MFKRLLRVILLLPAFAGLASCMPGENPGGDPAGTIVPKKARVNSIDDRVFVVITANGDWKVELEYPEDGPADWAYMDPASGSGDLENARLRFSENTAEPSRKVTMKLVMKGNTMDSATVEQLGTTGTPDWGEGQEGTSSWGWMELPAFVSDERQVFLAHDMTGQEYLGRAKSGQRNWSCLWDYEEHMSQWVAYPLNKALSGSSNFDYVWGFDPLLPERNQPDITQRSYGGVGFDGKNNWNRGHQLPRADRQISQAAVSSTCYPTNMTPQDGTFNSGIWVALESKVRSYATTSDTTYVVTGCIWKDSRTYTKNYSGYAVRVPDHYFKAILYYGSNSLAAATKKYMAAAFYLPHDPSIPKSNLMNYIMTVDELETLTGIDFFVNLPAAVGKETADKIESSLIASFWK